MPGLADLVLSSDVDDLTFEDAALAAELAELQARRRQHQAASPSPEQGGNAVPSTSSRLTNGQDNATAGQSYPEVGPPQPDVGKSSLRRTAGRSLADQILDGAVDVDRELKSMDEELQQHLSEYRQQRESAQISSTVPATPAGINAASLDRGLNHEAMASATGDVDASALHESMPPELAHLRAEAARMAQVFPDAPPNGEADLDLGARRRSIRDELRASFSSTLQSNARMENVPVDDGVLELREALENLDVRLRTIQKQDELYAGRARPEVHAGSGASKAIMELRAQNDHLRERMKETMARGGKGLMQLDRNVFAKAAPVASPSEA